VTGHNVVSWVTTVKSKLANVGILTIKIMIAEIHVINSKVFLAGNVPMNIHTLNIMVCEGIKRKVITSKIPVKFQNNEIVVFF
jgi:hypothetical protein